MPRDEVLLHGGGEDCTLPVPVLAKILQIKGIVMGTYGIDVERQRLVCRGDGRRAVALTNDLGELY